MSNSFDSFATFQAAGSEYGIARLDALEKAGLPVRVDRTSYHMHHKFALFDGEKLLTGSYNWTRSAAERNHENLLISDDKRLISAYTKTFDTLWDTLKTYT